MSCTDSVQCEDLIVCVSYTAYAVFKEPYVMHLPVLHLALFHTGGRDSQLRSLNGAHAEEQSPRKTGHGYGSDLSEPDNEAYQH